ncbi:M3 family metallopeptidase [Deinococcus peraridilitoris]|uniref:oligopeptidase A n=1 Tax=Deinococcus peraridilitoris (strain DSM 19664 / LMG 22246 / CIP 109416 / KR-200) TaxID=937777 RepID=L0A5P8_DEIPD|nr:M3 family metallopeptidase [Deinococcus peraridilitoris]AFZ68764.1 Zn-dependent oligopeptidase [Deinococcus peraridilitoris DSM 19664]
MISERVNPLLGVGFQIPFDQIRPEHAESAVGVLLASARQRLTTLTAANDPERFLSDLDGLTRELDIVTTIVGHLEAVVSSDDWRAAFNAILPKVSAFETELELSDELWQTTKRYSETPHARALTGERARFLQLTMDRFRRQGADLPPEKKERVKALDLELAEVTTKYRQNVLDGTAAFELYVDEDRLSGVPERARSALRAEAQKRGRDGYRLTLHLPSYQPVLTYADDRSLRQELWEASNRLAVDEGRDNRPLVGQILRLRAEKARLLGFDNFADLVLAERMTGSGARAQTFEADLEARVRPFYERENAELEAFYREQAGPEAPALQPWDVTYWAEKQRVAKYALDDEALRPYFPMESVLTGLFEITRRVFGARVEEAESPGWHEEVRYYNLYNRQGEHVASFYTDWFPRDSKRGGAWMNAFITGRPTPDGFLPHLGLMCGNLTPPVGSLPALLNHREVETVFHEFGHLLHHALSRVETRSLAGTSVAWDFVELPSQIMENWCWERDALDLFARHFETGERIPQELFEKMISARNYRAANAAMRQISFGTVDLALHMDWDGQRDPIEFSREILARFNPVELPHDYYFIAGFNHIFGSSVGYASGYYSYKWSEVLDADAFSRFAEEGIFNEVTGNEFVEKVLARGNSQDPAQLYRDFVGRDPDAEALLRRSGLSVS